MEKVRDICFNFNQICRFCLSQGGVMSAIFADSGQDTTSLPAKIMSCVPIQLFAGDGLPALICHRCLYQVERCYDFKEQCEHSDATLRQYLKKQRMGETCQVVMIKRENSEEDERLEKEILESYLSPQNDILGAKQTDMLYNGGAEILEIESPNLHESAEWACSFDNFLYEKSDGLLNTGHLLFRHEDIESVVMVVDPHSVDLDSMSDDDYSQTDNNNSYRGRKKSCIKMINNVNNIKRAKKFSVGRKTVGERPFSCPECGKRFAQRAHLARHGLVHTGERPYGCSVCGKAFADSSTLTTHTRTHTGERPFVCDICGKAFAGRSDLRKHAIIHTGRRPYVCNVCSKSFTRSTNLKKHSRIHSGVRPHACRECNKTFAAKGDLTRHALIHSGSKPFTCLVCNVAFSRRDKLTRHEKTHIQPP
ncbi:hypothetical protein L9F63_008643 [Diploptera punctata]|uniref:Uncharacterized protein n=1 Tax=Diploptera punctata TaxID=6984 RepID=A0AAD8E1I8_DIPPU|nr:hypothetical protein L9F63_008643 [Diploptera punctata]